MVLDLSVDGQQLFCNLVDFISDVVMINGVMAVLFSDFSFNSSLSGQVLLATGFSCLLCVCKCSVSCSCRLCFFTLESTDHSVSNFSCDSHFFSKISLEIFLILVLLFSHNLGCGKGCSKRLFSLRCFGVPVVCITFSLSSGDSSSTCFSIVVLFVLYSIEFSFKLTFLGNCLLKESLDFCHFIIFMVRRVRRCPVGLKSEFTCRSTMVLYHKPLVPGRLAAEGRQFALTVADLVVTTFVIIKD